MMKGFKIRIYPTKEQEKKIWEHIGSCRFIWNYMLDFQIKNRENDGKHIKPYDMYNMIASIRNDDDYAWLKNVSLDSLRRTCNSLERAYDGFFSNRTRFPKFKSRKYSSQRFPVRSDRLYFNKEYVHVEKIGKIKYKTDLDIKLGRDVCKFINATISYLNGKYMLSFVIECENQAQIITDKQIGIDLGIKELAVVACDDEQIVFHNINKSKRVRTLKRKIKHTQRTISRKYEASIKRTGKYEKTKNIEREENKLRKLHARITNIRHNYVHQTTAKLISILPKRITMEDLNVSGMIKNKHISNAIAEQCFYEFIRQMRYKCEWNGIELILAPRFYPSSKTCSCCGSIKRDLKLSDRTYVCNDCGLTIDRDYNAAINLMRYVDLHSQETA